MSQAKKPPAKPFILTPQTQAFLNEITSNKGLSKRAMKDVRESLTNGTPDWVDIVAKRKCSKTKSSPRPKGLKNHWVRPPDGLSRKKMLSEIMRDSPPQRDWFPGCTKTVDREAKKDELIRQFSGEDQVQLRSNKDYTNNTKLTFKQQLAEQIQLEIEERQTFCKKMRFIGSSEHDQSVKLEIASRIKELEGLGICLDLPGTSVPCTDLLA